MSYRSDGTGEIQMIEIHDNTLEPHVAELIDMQLRDISWKYNYDSVKNGVNKHWHVFCGHNIDECNLNGYDFIEPIWNNIKNVDSTLELERAYLNAHTYVFFTFERFALSFRNSEKSHQGACGSSTLFPETCSLL